MSDMSGIGAGSGGESLGAIMIEFGADLSSVDRALDGALPHAARGGARVGEAFGRGFGAATGAGIGARMEAGMAGAERVALRGGAGIGSSLAIGFNSGALNLIGGIHQLKSGLQDLTEMASGALGVGIAARYQSLETGIGGILKDAGAAKTLMGQLAKIGEDTPFDTVNLTGDVRGLLGVGVSAKNAAGDMQALADAVAAVNGSDADLDRLSHNMMQLRQSKRPELRDIKELQNLGIDVDKVMGAALGKKLAIGGGVEALQNGGRGQSGYELLIEGFHKEYGGAAKRMSGGTLGGIGQALNEKMVNAMKPTGEALLPGLMAVGTVAGNAAGAVGDFNKATGGAAGLIGALAIGVPIAKTLFGHVTGAFGAVGMLTRAIDGLAMSSERAALATGIGARGGGGGVGVGASAVGAAMSGRAAGAAATVAAGEGVGAGAGATAASRAAAWYETHAAGKAAGAAAVGASAEGAAAGAGAGSVGVMGVGAAVRNWAQGSKVAIGEMIAGARGGIGAGAGAMGLAKGIGARALGGALNWAPLLVGMGLNYAASNRDAAGHPGYANTLRGAGNGAMEGGMWGMGVGALIGAAVGIPFGLPGMAAGALIGSRAGNLVGSGIGALGGAWQGAHTPMPSEVGAAAKSDAGRPALSAQERTARATESMAKGIEDIKYKTLGGGDRTRRVTASLEAEYAMVQLMRTGLAG